MYAFIECECQAGFGGGMVQLILSSLNLFKTFKVSCYFFFVRCQVPVLFPSEDPLHNPGSEFHCLSNAQMQKIYTLLSGTGQKIMDFWILSPVLGMYLEVKITVSYYYENYTQKKKKPIIAQLVNNLKSSLESLSTTQVWSVLVKFQAGVLVRGGGILEYGSCLPVILKTLSLFLLHKSW